MPLQTTPFYGSLPDGRRLVAYVRADHSELTLHTQAPLLAERRERYVRSVAFPRSPGEPTATLVCSRMVALLGDPVLYPGGWIFLEDVRGETVGAAFRLAPSEA